MFKTKKFDQCADIALRQATAEGQWGRVHELLNHKVSYGTVRWTVNEALKRAGSDGHLVYILPHCANSQVHYVLKEAAKRNLWAAVAKLLARPSKITNSLLRRTVLQALKFASDDQLTGILSYCTDDQVDFVLQEAIKRRIWGTVAELLTRDVTDAARRTAVEEAVKNKTRHQHLASILLHCTDDQVDLALKAAATRRLWKTVAKLMTRDVTGATLKWAIEKAVSHARDEQLAVILCHCPHGQLGSLLTETVEKRQWSCVDVLLGRGGSADLQAWAVVEAIRHAGSDQLLALLHHCPHEHLDFALTETVERQLWDCVLYLLDSECFSYSLCEWAVTEACQHVEEHRKGRFHAIWKPSQEKSVTPRVKVTQRPHDIAATTGTDHETGALVGAVMGLQWATVLKLLQNDGVEDFGRAWAVESAILNADDNCLESILLQCTDGQVARALDVAQSKRLWSAFIKLMYRHNQRTNDT